MTDPLLASYLNQLDVLEQLDPGAAIQRWSWWPLNLHGVAVQWLFPMPVTYVWLASLVSLHNVLTSALTSCAAQCAHYGMSKRSQISF